MRREEESRITLRSCLEQLEEWSHYHLLKCERLEDKQAQGWDEKLRVIFWHDKFEKPIKNNQGEILTDSCIHKAGVHMRD